MSEISVIKKVMDYKIPSGIGDISRFLSIMFRPLVFLLPKLFIYLVFQSFDYKLLDEGYSRNVSCALNFISTLVLHTHSKFVVV